MEVTIVWGSTMKAAWYMGVKNPRPWYVPEATMAKRPRTALPTSPAHTPRSAMRSRGRSLVKPWGEAIAALPVYWLDTSPEYGSFPPPPRGLWGFSQISLDAGRSVVYLLLEEVQTEGRRSYERRRIRDHDRYLRHPFLDHHPAGPQQPQLVASRPLRPRCAQTVSSPPGVEAISP